MKQINNKILPGDLVSLQFPYIIGKVNSNHEEWASSKEQFLTISNNNAIITVLRKTGELWIIPLGVVEQVVVL